MLQTKAYRNFINGRYFSEGIRMAVGISLPAFIFGYFDMLAIGVVFSTGALCASVTDSAGPVHHRANGMFFCNILVAVVSIITYWTFSSFILTGAWILIAGFIFSMLSVYNARVSSVGISALLILILCMQAPLKGADVYWHALYLLAGGTWYMIFSLLLHTIRPYKIIQQLSGEFISGVAAYLKTRASFYSDHPDYETTYRSLLQQQVQIQAQQTALNELLFKTRAITKNSTHTGRSLLKIYLDISDLFESIMSVYQQYEVLHKKFDETGILAAYRQQLLLISGELFRIAETVATGSESRPAETNARHLLQVREKFEVLRKDFMTEKNVDDFIGLGRIFNNIRNLTEKTDALHYYTGRGKKQKEDADAVKTLVNADREKYFDAALFINNLNPGSNIFRHSLRVALSLLMGFLISLFFHIGHSYWILLTIVVILKPAYSLTKHRNRDRLLGTILGIFIGVGILFAIKSKLFLLITMMIFMAISYMFIRTKYFISVLLMTVYLVIFFHIIYPVQITAVLTDRLLDTLIGSAIAFLSGRFLIPAWEHESIRKYMGDMLLKDIDYYKCVAVNFTDAGSSTKNELKKSRQKALTALANLTDAFNRMLSEPKRHQKNNELIYRFVVLNHILTSHFSALAFYLEEQKHLYRSAGFLPVIRETEEKFKISFGIISGNNTGGEFIPGEADILRPLHFEADILMQARRKEVSAGDLETDTKKKLVEMKSVTDQFTYIYNLSDDLVKNTTAFAGTPDQ